MELYNKRTIGQQCPAKFENDTVCSHCQWICRTGPMPGEHYCQMNLDPTTGDGVSVFLSGNRYEYAFVLVRNIHKVDNDVDVLMQSANKFVHHLSTLGISDVHVALSHHWEEKLFSKEHQHVWVVVDKNNHKDYDEIFAMHRGYGLHSVKARKRRDIVPYKSDRKFDLKHISDQELTKLAKNPLQYVQVQNLDKSFYIFIHYIDNDRRSTWLSMSHRN